MMRKSKIIIAWWRGAGRTFGQLAGYLALSLAVTVVISSRYLAFAPPAASLHEWFFVRTAVISNVAMLYLLLLTVLVPLLLLIPRRLLMVTLSVLLIWILQAVLIVDLTIYKLYRFHFNGLIWNIFETEAGWEAVTVGTMTWLTFGVIAILLLGVNIGTHVLVKWLMGKGIVRLRPVRSMALLLLFIITVILVDKGQFAYADLYNNTTITRHGRLLPLYQPLTIKRYVRQHWGVEAVNRQVEINRPASGVVNYPLESLSFDERASRPNMVVIVIDSYRYDMLTPEVTPNIHAFAKGATVFRRHYSGGNATRFGIFGLLYGLHGSYWHSILTERVSPVLMDAFQGLDYRIKILSSLQLTFPEFRMTAFVNMTEVIEDRLEGDGAKEKDPALVERFAGWLDSLDGSGPFFAYLFLAAPHSGASYPDDFAKFQPRVDNVNYMSLDRKKDITPFLNHFKNAVYFADHVTGTILTALEDRQLLDSTVVLITGDHGEEFYERGFWGHTSAFSPEQVQVPLVLYLPGQPGRRVEQLTSHLDVPATLLDLMGCTTDPQAYSLGASLLSEDYQREYAVAGGWDEFGIIDTAVTLVISSETYNLGSFEARDAEYRLLEDAGDALSSRIGRLREVMEDMARFYQ
ncbi:sulfatase-like hydrolase/transferase [Candidatus Neomarinimicrobiota bacterium]